jgi:protein-disulfide isomerase
MLRYAFAASSMLLERVKGIGWGPVVVGSALAAAFTLSVFLAVGLCTEACKAVYRWTIFGVKFHWLGIGFFAVSLILFRFRESRWPGLALNALIFGACGAEATFLYVQHSIIRRWCPLCLAIAFLVFAAGIALAAGPSDGSGMKILAGRGKMARLLAKGFLLVSVMLAGATVSFLGLGNPADSQAETLPVALGKTDSEIEVYVFTDWFCPACKIAEPEMEKAYPEILARGKLLFIEHPIHKESLNYLPYNLSFLVREKAKYLEIRKALMRLAQKTKEPTPEEVQKAVAPLGVVYRPLNYSEVNAAAQYFASVVKAFRVEGTPSVVVYHRKTKTHRLFTGVKDLSEANLRMAVSGVAPP